jgi:hypothetical protein
VYLLLKGLSHEMAVYRYLLLRRVRKRGTASTQLPTTSTPYIRQPSSLLLPSARYYYHLPLVLYPTYCISSIVYRYFLHIFLQCSGSGSASIRINFALHGAVNPDPEQGAWRLTKNNKKKTISSLSKWLLYLRMYGYVLFPM